MGGKNKLGFEVMQERARELKNELLLCKDPDKAYELVVQMFQESESWMERYPVEMTGDVWVPVFKAAFDAVAAIRTFLDNNPDIQQDRKDKFARLVSACESLQDEHVTPGSTLIKAFN